VAWFRTTMESEDAPVKFHTRTFGSGLALVGASLALVATQPHAGFGTPSIELFASLDGNVEVAGERVVVPFVVESEGCEAQPGFTVNSVTLDVRLEPKVRWLAQDHLEDTGSIDGNRRSVPRRIVLEIVHVDDVIQRHEYDSVSRRWLDIELDQHCGWEGFCGFAMALESKAGWSVDYNVMIDGLTLLREC